MGSRLSSARSLSPFGFPSLPLTFRSNRARLYSLSLSLSLATTVGGKPVDCAFGATMGTFSGAHGPTRETGTRFSFPLLRVSMMAVLCFPPPPPPQWLPLWSSRAGRAERTAGCKIETGGQRAYVSSRKTKRRSRAYVSSRKKLLPPSLGGIRIVLEELTNRRRRTKCRLC